MNFKQETATPDLNNKLTLEQLIRELQSRTYTNFGTKEMSDSVKEFRNEYSFLSNFYPSEVELDGTVYPTVEHAFQAAKTLNPTERKHIRKMASPKEAKHAGKSVCLRVNWDKIKLSVMEDLVYQKFVRHPTLRHKLVATAGKHLYEGNQWNDTYWGMDLRTGRGENHLGKILMKVRARLVKVKMLLDPGDVPNDDPWLDAGDPGEQ